MSILIESVVIILINMFSMFLQHGSIDYTVLLNYHSILTIVGSFCVWFVNKYTLGRILQFRIESKKITKYLPFELLVASILVTSAIYIVFYLIIIYIEKSDFEPTYFLQGLSLTIGFCLLIVMIYIGGQVWNSWWSDGEFLFHINDNGQTESVQEDFIPIKNSRGTININLDDIHYFISESKIVFLIDTFGKKWITQYNLTELENILDDRFFRLNRGILVSRQVISHIKKLPNHRLLVTIGQSNESHSETISRYKSTRFKHWYHSA